MVALLYGREWTDAARETEERHAGVGAGLTVADVLGACALTLRRWHAGSRRMRAHKDVLVPGADTLGRLRLAGRAP